MGEGRWVGGHASEKTHYVNRDANSGYNSTRAHSIELSESESIHLLGEL